MATESRIISIISSLHNKVVSPTNQSLQLNQVHLPSQFPGKAIDMRVLHFTMTTKELEFQAFLCSSLWACGACVCARARVLGCTWIIKWRCDIFFLSLLCCGPQWTCSQEGPLHSHVEAGCAGAAHPAPTPADAWLHGGCSSLPQASTVAPRGTSCKMNQQPSWAGWLKWKWQGTCLGGTGAQLCCLSGKHAQYSSC